MRTDTKTDKPSQDVELWLAIQEVANATTDLPDVDGFMERFGEALTNAVHAIGPDAAMANFTDVPEYDGLSIAKSHSKWITDALARTHCCTPAKLALASIFTERMSGGLKSKYAREFIIKTCHEAMAAGV